MARVRVERRSAMVESSTPRSRDCGGYLVESSSHSRAQTSREQPQSRWRSRASHGREQSTRVATAQPRAAVVEISSHGEQKATVESRAAVGSHNRDQPWWRSRASRVVQQPQSRAATVESSHSREKPGEQQPPVESSNHGGEQPARPRWARPRGCGAVGPNVQVTKSCALHHD